MPNPAPAPARKTLKLPATDQSKSVVKLSTSIIFSSGLKRKVSMDIFSPVIKIRIRPKTILLSLISGLMAAPAKKPAIITRVLTEARTNGIATGIGSSSFLCNAPVYHDPAKPSADNAATRINISACVKMTLI